MSLKTEIDKINDLKNKTKKAKTNINTKLIEFGGQNATDLADIPNKIQDLKSKCKKRAVITINRRVSASMSSKTELIALNLNFNPSKVFVFINNNVITNNFLKYYVDNSFTSSNPTTCKVDSLTKENLTLQFSYLENATIKRIEILGD